MNMATRPLSSILKDHPNLKMQDWSSLSTHFREPREGSNKHLLRKVIPILTMIEKSRILLTQSGLTPLSIRSTLTTDVSRGAFSHHVKSFLQLQVGAVSARSGEFLTVSCVPN